MGIFKDYDTHESWGMLGLSHMQTGRCELFGSDVEHHNIMKLTLKQGKCSRELGQDWCIGDKLIAEVYLSANQFADLLTNTNIGDGVPCTIVYRVDKGSVDYKPQRPKVEIWQEEADERADKAVEEIDRSIDKIKELLEKGKIPKGVGNEILTAVSSAKYNLVGGGKEFFQKRAREDVEKMVVEAKREVQSYVNHKIYSTGIQALQEGFTTPNLIENNKNENK